MDILPRTFYARNTLVVARELLGKVLVHRTEEGVTRGRIVEVEAYLGEEDPASHAAVGRSGRAAVLFGPPGHAYVYFSYGMHHCINAVTEREGKAGAVLIRALEPVDGLDLMAKRRGTRDRERLTSGPGNLTQALGIHIEDDGLDLTQGALVVASDKRWALDGTIIRETPRIGVRQGVDKPYRFFLEGNPHVSCLKSRPT